MSTPQATPLTEELKASLKQKHAGKRLFVKEIFGQEYVFTPLTRAQYAEISEWAAKTPNLKVSAYEERIAKTGLLWPEIHVTAEPTLVAGLYPTLSELVKEKSYLSAPEGDFSKLYSCESLQEKEEATRPTEEEIKKLKASCPWPLNLLNVRGGWFVVRPLLRHEWNQLQALPENMDTDVECCKHCVRWPENHSWEMEEAGIPAVVSRHTMLLSGFSDTGDVSEL